MASIDVGIHPDPAGITSRHFPGFRPFSTLDLDAGESHVSIFVNSRADLDALYAALHMIEADMGRAEQAAMAAKRAARADEIRADMAQTASDQVPTVMADWPSVLSDMAPGELVEIHGK